MNNNFESGKRGYERSYGASSEQRSSRKFRISPFVSEQIEEKEDKSDKIKDEIEMPYVTEGEAEHGDMKNEQGDYEPMYPLDEFIPIIPQAPVVPDKKPVSDDSYECEMSKLQLIANLAQAAQKKTVERAFGAKGIGAFGKFTANEGMNEYTKADFLSKKGKTTPAFVRFSPMFQARGGADTARDIRMFEIKLDTDEGIYDIFAINTPVFFIRNGEKLPNLMDAMSPSQKNGIRNIKSLMELASETPEMTQALMRFFSNEGTQKSYVNMNGYTPNTYVWVNGEGDANFAKYVILPRDGYENISSEDAQFYAGRDPDIAMRELCLRLESGKAVEYDVYVQLISPETVNELDFDVTDATRSWGDAELIPMGVLTLERCTDDYSQVENAAFSPSNTVNGIEHSSDELLYALSFFMPDSDRYRLGAHYGKLDINKGKAAQGYIKKPYKCDMKRKKTDDFIQAEQFYATLSPLEKEQMIYNIADAMKECDSKVCERLIEYFTNVNDDFGNSINIALDATK